MEAGKSFARVAEAGGPWQRTAPGALKTQERLGLFPVVSRLVGELEDPSQTQTRACRVSPTKLGCWEEISRPSLMGDREVNIHGVVRALQLQKRPEPGRHLRGGDIAAGPGMWGAGQAQEAAEPETAKLQKARDTIPSK